MSHSVESLFRPIARSWGVALLLLAGSCSETQYKMPGDSSKPTAGAAGAAGAFGGGSVSKGGTAPDGSGSGGKSTEGGSSAVSSGRGGTPAGGNATGGVSEGGAPSGGSNASTTATTYCGIEPNPTDDRSKRHLLVRDVLASKLAYIDVASVSNYWEVALDRGGRDLQLVGNCRALLPTNLGYDEYDLQTHQRVAEVTAYPGTLSAQRLRNHNTLLVGVGTTASPWQGKIGIVLLQIDASGAVILDKTLVYPGTYVSLVRQTPQGTFLVTNNKNVFEGDIDLNVPDDGYNKMLSPTFVSPSPHAWLGLRIATAGVNETVVASGDGASLLVFRADGTIRKTITGGTASIDLGANSVNPYFFAGLQVLANGNYLVSNWSGVAGNFADGIPLLEYNPAGALLWYWGEPSYAGRLSGIQAAISLDGLELTKLQVEGSDGKLTSAP